MKKAFLAIIITLLTVPSAMASQTLRASIHTLTNPRIVISGGRASSDNYELNNITIGGLTGGHASGGIYGLDATKPALDALNPDPTDITPPYIDSITPPDGSIVESGGLLKISCEAEDSNTPIYYKYIINDSSIINNDWNTTPEISWDSSNLKKFGLFQIKAEAKDIAGNKSTRESECYLLRKPPALP